jgi:hypothetical protein
MRTIAMATLLALAAAGCGGSKGPATGSTTAGSTAAAHGGEHHDEHHANLPSSVRAFHELLSPLWHADPGDKRTQDTCSAMEDLRQRAADIVVAETPPAATGDEAAYRDAASALVHAVVELGEACAADGRPAFADRFAEVHTAFHVVMEKASPR